MNFIELLIPLPCGKSETGDIVTAFLAELGFDSFSLTNNTLKAYIIESDYCESNVSELLERFSLEYKKNVIPQKNWNEEWEKNYPPVIIKDILTIKAPFHKQTFKTKYQITIEPKMAFGTGHHETTSLMCEIIAEMELKGLNVLDMGCGSGILSVFASMCGAKHVTAIDIDEWSYKSTIENAQINKCENINTIQGDVNAIPETAFDVIFANINLNILRQDIPAYVDKLKNKGRLVLSGFYANENNDVANFCKDNGLFFVNKLEKNKWSAMIFNKTNN